MPHATSPIDASTAGVDAYPLPESWSEESRKQAEVSLATESLPTAGEWTIRGDIYSSSRDIDDRSLIIESPDDSLEILDGKRVTGGWAEFAAAPDAAVFVLDTGEVVVLREVSVSPRTTAVSLVYAGPWTVETRDGQEKITPVTAD